MKKIPKQAYTAEFKKLGLGDQTFRNGIKAAAERKRKGADCKVVMPEAMAHAERFVEVVIAFRMEPRLC